MRGLAFAVLITTIAVSILLFSNRPQVTQAEQTTPVISAEVKIVSSSFSIPELSDFSASEHGCGDGFCRLGTGRK